MAITVQQLPVAISTANDLASILENMRMLLTQAKDLSDKNWQIDIGSRGSIILTVSPAQQLAMIALYDSYKTQLTTTFQQLP